jgi:hypothetical protein
MLSIFWAIVDGIVSFWAKNVLERLFPAKSPTQVAVNTEAKMGQDIADKPDQEQAVKRLESDET